MINPSPNPKPTREPTIALINVVFLMLVFFMVAGTLAPPLDRDVSLVQVQALDGREPPDTLVIHKDGTLFLRGVELTSPEAFMERLTDDDRRAVRIVPDRDLPAHILVAHARAMQVEGAERVRVVTERGLE